MEKIEKDENLQRERERGTSERARGEKEEMSSILYFSKVIQLKCLDINLKLF